MMRFSTTAPFGNSMEEGWLYVLAGCDALASSTSDWLCGGSLDSRFGEGEQGRDGLSGKGVGEGVLLTEYMVEVVAEGWLSEEGEKGRGV
jgi:hypothetical protein